MDHRTTPPPPTRDRSHRRSRVLVVMSNVVLALGATVGIVTAAFIGVDPPGTSDAGVRSDHGTLHWGWIASGIALIVAAGAISYALLLLGRRLHALTPTAG